MKPIAEKVKRQNNVSIAVLIFFTVVMLIGLISRVTRINDGVIMTIICVVSAAGAIFVCVRSFLTDYEYIIYEGTDKEIFFAVIQTNGRRRMTVCNTNLRNVSDAVSTTNGKIEGKLPSAKKRVSYRKSMMPKRWQAIYFSNGSDIVAVKTEMSEIFFDEFMRAVSEAKKKRKDDSDDDD